MRHFEQILKETSVDLVIYNIPAFTGQTLTAATIKRIAALDSRVAGYKDTSNNFADFSLLLDELGDTPFCMLQGASNLAMPAMLLGADGFVPAMATCFPQLFVDAYEAGKCRNLPLAKAYAELMRRCGKVLAMSKNATASAKYAISLRGFTRKDVIMPQDGTLPEEEAAIREAVAQIDADYADLKSSQ